MKIVNRRIQNLESAFGFRLLGHILKQRASQQKANQEGGNKHQTRFDETLLEFTEVLSKRHFLEIFRLVFWCVPDVSNRSYRR